MTEKTIPAKRRLSAAQRQEEIVRVAIALAAEQGVDAVTTQDMAAEMNLTQGAIFRHFATKDDIWYAVMQWVRSRLTRVLDGATAGETNPVAALEKIFFAHLAFIQKHPAIPRLLFSEHLHKRNSRLQQLIQEIITGYEEKIAGLLRKAKVQGLAFASLDEESAATLYIGMIHGLVLGASIFQGKRSMLEEGRKIFPIFLNSLKAHDRPA